MKTSQVRHPILKALLRGGGGSEHDRLKISAWSWLLEGGSVVVDFEVGGFDVLGLSKKRSPLSGRTVIDAKTSKADLYNHFKKEVVPSCDIDGKFSQYGSEHYIISNAGVIPVDAVHAPWGLLECDGQKVKLVKAADARAYIGGDDDIFSIAERSTLLLGSFISIPELVSDIKESSKEILLDKNGARKAISELKDRLVRYCTTFETLYGYNPLRREYLES